MVIKGLSWSFAAVATAAALVASGCGGSNGDSRPKVNPSSFAAGDFPPSVTAAKKPVTAAKKPVTAAKKPVTAANKWLPLEVGTQWVREGHVYVGHRTLTHRVVTTVTGVSKRVGGVRTIVVLDQDFNGGQLSEQSLDYQAADKRGNVWYLGSYTELYEGGQFVNAAGAWLAGVNGSKGGIYMPADPRTGTPAYSPAQPAGGPVDTARVAKTGVSKCVPFKCYKNVLVIDEGNGDEYKYFAPGVGQIKTEPQGAGGKQEVEELVNLTHLSPKGLAEISAEALKLDANAAKQQPAVFGNAAPGKRTR